MRIYVKNIPAKFHQSDVKRRSLRLFWGRSPQQEEEEQQQQDE